MSYIKGSKVKYRPIVGDAILGEVIAVKRDILGEYIEWRVTSRKSMFYPCGLIDHTSADSPWLSLR